MIHQIRLSNFKCFDSLHIDLAPLTLLTGFNAGGKSSVIQTLLLLCQSLRGYGELRQLLLNGPLVNLGMPVDVLNARAGEKRISLGIRMGAGDATWHFALSEKERRTLLLTNTIGGHSSLISQLESLIYLSAARQVDTDVFPLSPDFGALADVGPIGQYAASWLHEMGEDHVAPQRRHPNFPDSLTIRQHVNAWLGDLFPGTESNAVPITQTNLIRLQLRSGFAREWLRPANIGYGISYAFPMIVAGVCCAAGQTVILDSPEAHLHPRAQSRVGRFLTQIANGGVQLLVETHSDHVLNGVRIAIRDGLIAPERVAIYFFSGLSESPVIRLSVDKHGSIHDLPDGFFDQAERDLGSLAGWN